MMYVCFSGRPGAVRARRPDALPGPPAVGRGILYYSTPREESFTILLPERNPLLFYSQRVILYYSTPREESFTILLPERNPLLFYSQRGILY